MSFAISLKGNNISDMGAVELLGMYLTLTY